MKNKFVLIYGSFILLFNFIPLNIFDGFLFSPDANQHFDFFIPADKLGHFFIYFGFGIVVLKTTVNSIYSYLYGILFGIIMECCHYFLPYRSFEFLDMMANVLGYSIIFVANLRKK